MSTVMTCISLPVVKAKKYQPDKLNDFFLEQIQFLSLKLKEAQVSIKKSIEDCKPVLDHVRKRNEELQKIVRPIFSQVHEQSRELSKIYQRQKKLSPLDFIYSSNYLASINRGSASTQKNITININIQGNTILSREFIRPKTSRWEQISIMFLNSHDVKIRVGENIQKVTFCDLGFMSQTTTKPKTSWELLEKFATHKGIISKSMKDRHPNFKQELGMLRSDLKKCFGIAEDPFENTRNGECKIKIDISG